MRRSPAETPLMRQYLAVKEEQPDGILMFRMGDFYEMFFDDAVVASKALDLTLTSRDKGKEDAIPMCGVPHHAGRGYIARLAELGHKVVICEQLEDPKHAKGIVKRGVTQVVTPGILLDEDLLDAKAARYVACIVRGELGAGAASGAPTFGKTTRGPVRSIRAKNPSDAAAEPESWGLAYLDVTTGEFVAVELTSATSLFDELARVAAKEALLPRDAATGQSPPWATELGARLQKNGTSVSWIAAWGADGGEEDPAAVLSRTLNQSMKDLGLDQRRAALVAAAQVLVYAQRTQPGGQLPVVRLRVRETHESLVLDEAAQAHLEIVESSRDRKKNGSLLGVIDLTKTSPGGRLLRRWLLFPQTDVATIRRRQDAVQVLALQASGRESLRRQLGELADIERLAGRVTLGVVTPRDLGSLRDTLGRLPALCAEVEALHAHQTAKTELLRTDPALLESVGASHQRLLATLAEEPPLLSTDAGVVKDGVCPLVDELRGLAGGARDAILAIELRERERTGIPLRVRFNRVFGYYIEITRSQLARVPADYVRKQTLANAERYVTPELYELEAKVLGAEEKLKAREKELFDALRSALAAEAAPLLRAGAQIASWDALQSLAEVAHRHGYVRPEVDDSAVLEIEEGRHPVVERFVGEGVFVPNDTRLDPKDCQLVVLTGPNMAGKSTYMRQVAHIVLLAQMGSFVPAKRARIGIVDRLFTRVGAQDFLARGDSTFMVEMRETAAILRHATARSLVILDEIGRGTSTYDGLSIAWAVAEYLHDAIGAKTLFATHYHELTALGREKPRVQNLSVAVVEREGGVVFLHRVTQGAANRSYGIEVAKLAGLPRSVVARSRQLLAELELAGPAGQASRQLSLMPAAAPSPLVCALRDADPDGMTPREALAFLCELKALVGT